MEGGRNRSRTRLFRDVRRSASEPATRGRTKEKPRDGRGSLACAHTVTSERASSGGAFLSHGPWDRPSSVQGIHGADPSST